MPVIHVVIPFLDEESTLATIVSKLDACVWPSGWSSRIVLVDDGSSKPAGDAAKALADDASDSRITLLRHNENRGKGAALRTGFESMVDTAAEGDLVAIQDADLEYDPVDLLAIIKAIQSAVPPADAAFGNRWTDLERSTIRRAHRLGNRLLTRLSNAMTGLAVTDMECCYKVFRIPMLRTILPDLDEDRFAIEPQLAAALARHGAHVIEVPIHYEPRSFSQGKKIGFGDAVAAIASILREWRRTRKFSRFRP